MICKIGCNDICVFADWLILFNAIIISILIVYIVYLNIMRNSK